MTYSFTLRAPAKINPILEVLGKRPDGFHELVLLFQAVALFDELTFFRDGNGVRLEVLDSPTPLAADDSNLVVKAAKLFLKEILGREEGVLIRLKKRIPLAAGLGGGSSDAAATLLGLDRVFETKLGKKRLESLAAPLGSDVPYFLTGGTALGTGRGENITPLEPAPPMSLVLAKPEKGLSTASVYQSGKALLSSGERSRNFRKLLQEGNRAKIAGALFNSLQPAAFFLMPEVEALKQELLQAGAQGALVSGSGPTVFGIAENERMAGRIAETLKGEGKTVIVTSTIPSGVEERPD